MVSNVEASARVSQRKTDAVEWETKGQDSNEGRGDRIRKYEDIEMER